MYKCLYCGYRGPEVAHSPTLDCYCCDECFTDHMDAKEQANIDACSSNGEQDF